MKSTTPNVRAFCGVYSTSYGSGGPGQGAQAGKAKAIYWAAYDLPGHWVEVQPLTDKMIPAGASRRVYLEEFERHFTPEPALFVKSSQLWSEPEAPGHVRQDAGRNTASGRPQPARPARQDRQARAGKVPVEPLEHTQGPAPAAAPTQGPEEAKAPPAHADGFLAPRSRAMNRTMAALRAEGRAQLHQGRLEQAMNVYRRILKLDGPFEPLHKFVLNDCGIDMRRVGRYDVALDFYRRAMEVEDNDENLYHNTARAFYEKGELEHARRYLILSLAINPELTASSRFLRHIERRDRNEREMLRHGAH